MLQKKAILYLATLFLYSCAGYQLGGAKPENLSHVYSLSYSHFGNLTLEPRVSTLATNSFVDALTQDGTYAIRSQNQADAHLIASVTTIDYQQHRSNRFDTLASDELRTTVNIDWQLKKNNQVISKGTSSGSTTFFAGENLHLSRRNALPLAISRATQNMVTSLSEGF